MKRRRAGIEVALIWWSAGRSRGDGGQQPLYSVQSTYGRKGVRVCDNKNNSKLNGLMHKRLKVNTGNCNKLLINSDSPGSSTLY